MKERVRELDIPLSLADKLKHLLMGRRRPGIVTRSFFWAGLAISWGYFFIWNLISYISLISLHGLLKPKPEARVLAYFTELGQKYEIVDAFSTYKLYCLIQLGILTVILFGLFFIWRRWVLGALLFLVANVASLIVTIIMLSWDFYMNEVTYFDKILQGSSILGGIFILFFLRNYANKKRARLARRW